MTVSTSNTFNKSPADVFAAYLSDDYVTAKYEALGNRNVKVLERNTEGNVTTIRQQRDVQADVPSFAKKFLSEWNTVEETYVWTNNGDNITGTLNASISGAPISISGTMSLKPNGDGTQEDLSMTPTVKIPLIGKKLQAKVEEDMAASMDQEKAFNEQYFG